MSADPRLHVLVWVEKEFLESEGMLFLLHETGLLADKSADWEKVVEAAENTGGFALSGLLTDSNHGAGLWIAPVAGDEGVDVLVPWRFVKSVVTAHQPDVPKLFNAMGRAKRDPKLAKL